MYPHWDKTPKSEADWIQALINLARYLRSPDGCPWDREQTSATLAAFVRDETHELVEAIATGDSDHIAEELGDVLFVLLVAAAAAEEEGKLVLADALHRTHEKMIRRHDHVFGESSADSPEQVIDSWRRIKEQEKNGGI